MNVDPVEAAILKALADGPFLAVRELAGLTCLPRSTAHGDLPEPLCSTVRHLRWIPHHLSEDQRAIRVNLSREFLAVLEAQQSRGWHDIVTLDES
jgi:hypothetical protein